MTDNNITISVPADNAQALSGASLFLFNMANNLIGDQPTIEEAATTHGNAALGPEADPDTPTDTPISRGENVVIPPIGVDLDKEGLPYDIRIHSSSKKKLAKTDCWKKKKGVDHALVTAVEAELRATMAASPAAPIAPTPAAPVNPNVVIEPKTPTPPAAPPVTAEVKYLVDGAEFTESQLKASGWNDNQIAMQQKVNPAAPAVAVTFPELMSKITNAVTAKQISDTDVTAALNAQGLTSIPLLASRPDLIPAVHTALFG